VYYQSHKEKIAENMKEYYNDNKEKINKQRKEYHKEYRKLNIGKLKDKHECECGGKYTCNDKSRHFKTKKHIKYIE